MVGRKSLAIAGAVLGLTACVTTPSGGDDDNPELDTVVSSSVRIERRSRGPAIAHVERQCDVGEVQRVIELLAAAGAKRVNLKVENGASADVITRLPAATTAKDQWLVVSMTDTGFKLYLSSAEYLNRTTQAKGPVTAEIQDVPLRDGEPDWEKLTAQVRSMAARQSNLAGASVVAPSGGRADRAIEALQQIRFALPEPQRRFLLAL